MDDYKSKFENIRLDNKSSKKMTPKEFDYYIYKERKVDPFRLGSYYSVNTSSLNNLTGLNYTGVYIWGNSSAYASLPTFASEYGQAFVNRYKNDEDFYSFKIYNYPLPLTKKQKNLAQNAGSFYVALIFAIGMAFIPTGLVTFIVKEREHNIKHQHLVSGVSILAYWLSSLVWDLLKYMLPGIVTPLLIKAFDLKALLEPDSVYNAVWYLFLLFGFAICPYTYAISFLFKSYSVAQFFIFLLNLIVGVIGGLAVWVLIIISDTTRNVAEVLVYFFRLVSPVFCLSYGLMTVSNRDAYQLAYGKRHEPDALDWDITGASLFFMFLHFVVGTLAVFLIEWLSTVTFFRNLIAARDPGPNDYFPDDDVERMKEEAKESSADVVAVKVSGLRKIYGNLFNKNDTKIAIQEVSFVVPRQQAFALLGVNGAGKTTTFRILTGEYGPTVGEAYISGYNVVTDLASARYNIGYCPQFDALSEVLTPVEHLKLYARIKGIPKNLIKTFVDKQISDMGLTKYIKVRAGNLSGGNKRKLSVAIATIGNPPVVFLDEPSAGMDPNARKNMWEVVNRIKRQKCSIILTTHSMDEAESLCNTMAIMVNGRFKCYGTATHIKNKYSSGYEFLLKVKFPTAEEIETISGFMKTYVNQGFVGENNLKLALQAATVEDLFENIAEHESGAHLFEEIKENKKVDVKSLAEWIILEKIGMNINGWLEKEFRNIRLIEHFGSYYKFKLEKREDITIGGLFGKIEDAKDALKIEEYSLSQTTLEQIFNMFATEGEGHKLKQRLSGSQRVTS
jgi:ATP-binding cassette subfamily A (ABC1) protein 3